MKILGIETSCDETAAAVVENGTKILSSALASSAQMHAITGGVIPEEAARQQVKSIIPMIKKVVEALTLDEIDAVAVTSGPGLIGSLLVGVETAKTLSRIWDKPIVPVNHLIAHLYANWLGKKSLPKFPALGLVVSGGHTDLVIIKSHGDIKWIGGTRDDAAGEAFDKTARLLGLPYPGGPNISKLAEKYISKNHGILDFFPRPLADEENFDWSFSGLKTAVLRQVQNPKSKMPDERLAAEVQEAIVDSLVNKTVKALVKFKINSLLLAGGVAANSRLREKFNSELKSKVPTARFHVPEPEFCTDNAAYIASSAFFNFKAVNWRGISANPELTITDQI